MNPRPLNLELALHLHTTGVIMYRPQKEIVQTSAYSSLDDIAEREVVYSELKRLTDDARVDVSQAILEHIVNTHLKPAIRDAKVSEEQLGAWLDEKWLDEIIDKDRIRKVMIIAGEHWSKDPQVFGGALVAFLDIEDRDKKRLESLVWVAPKFKYIRLQFRWTRIVIND